MPRVSIASTSILPRPPRLRSGPLDEAEREVMKGHVDMGMKIVERVIGQSDEGNLVNVSILRNIVANDAEIRRLCEPLPEFLDPRYPLQADISIRMH